MPFPENSPPLLPFSDAPTRSWRRRLGFRRYERPEPPRWRRYAWHLLLFVITLITTTLAGVQLTRGSLYFLPIEIFALPKVHLWAELKRGLWFSLPFLGVLTVHEFGHYFTARYNKVSASLPYFIPFVLGIGTFGAVIRIKDRIFSRREFSDIGIAGPLAGFVVAVAVLIYGFASLPPLDYIFQIHPEYRAYGARYADYVYRDAEPAFILARPLLYRLLEYWFADPDLLPHPNEMLHYPVLVAGVLALFFTALNLLPIGQLDGGHILYGLLGFERFNRLAVVLFVGFIFYAGLGLFTPQTDGKTWLYWGLPYFLYLLLVFRRAVPTLGRAILLALSVWGAQLVLVWAVPAISGNPGWLILGLVFGRFTGIFHPPAPDERPLSRGRKVLSWMMVVIFVLCFTPSPFE